MENQLPQTLALAMENIMITQEENLILQSYMTVSLLAELGNNKFFESDCFSKMTFGVPDIKKFLKTSGVR